MNVLVTSASRHGATREIAEAIAGELRAGSLDAEVLATSAVGSLDGYQAVVIGSAVYMGNWLAEARRFVEQHRAFLATVPVWLFSSGPVGFGDVDQAKVGQLVEAIHARGHRVFDGRLERSRLGLAERLLARMVKAPEGDYRDWDAIRSWAREIVGALRSGAASP